MFLYLYWVRDYSEHDCYYTALERTGCHQRLLQYQPKVWLEDESPDQMPRRMTASSLCLSVTVVKPYHALDAYVSFAGRLY